MPTETNEIPTHVVRIPSESAFDVAYKIGIDGEIHPMAAPDITFTIAERAGADDEDCDVLLSLPKLLRGLSMSIELGKELSGAPLEPGSLALVDTALATTHTLMSDSVSPGLQAELARLIGPSAADTRSQAELRIASAQMASWGSSLLECTQQSVAAQAQALAGLAGLAE
jgi:hypothetical protein